MLFESWSVVSRLCNEPCMSTVIVEYLQEVVCKFNVAPGLQIPYRWMSLEFRSSNIIFNLTDHSF